MSSPCLFTQNVRHRKPDKKNSRITGSSMASKLAVAASGHSLPCCDTLANNSIVLDRDEESKICTWHVTSSHRSN